jgi:hypothetical protein
MSSNRRIKVGPTKIIYLDYNTYISVFLGHKVPEMNRSANNRVVIARRAEVCARKPDLLFDYDHQNNCEAFANILMGVAAPEEGELGAMAQSVPCCLVGLCNMIGCLRGKGHSLMDVVNDRLEKARKDNEDV